MVFKAGSICKFNCCQNGRDMPDDNRRHYNSNGDIYYDLCPPHYFLIISTESENRHSHKDYSHMSSASETEKGVDIKICTAVPLDDISDKRENNRVVSLTNEDDIFEGYNNRILIIREELGWLKRRHSIILCNKICKINVNKKLTDTIGFLGEDRFLEVINKIQLFLNDSKKELECTFKDLNSGLKN